MSSLATKYAGLNLNNPIIAASSGLTETVNNVKQLEKAGVGAIVLKSVFEEEILMEMQQVKNEMVGQPYVFPETMDYMDQEPHEDLIRKYLEFIKSVKSEVEVPIIASINCISDQKWTYLANEIEKAGADALELNLFSLPSDTRKPAGEIEEMYLSIVKQIIQETKIPIILKISHYYTALGQMIEKFANSGASGLVLFNRYYSPDIDINKEILSSSFVLSSKKDIQLPLRWIALSANKIKVDLAASSGVHDGEALVKTLLAGASAAQVASGLYMKGPGLVKEMLDFLENWMKEKEYKYIADFKGKLSHTKDNNNAQWERVQFMKEFSHFVK